MSIILSAAILLTALISVLIFIALIVFAVNIYNSLITLKINIERASSNIDVLTKQRFDEIPNLVEVCKGYMRHEAKTLQEVVSARNFFLNSKETVQKLRADFALDGALKGLYAVSENYPELKANDEFMYLQKRITGLENAIADRREFYNASVAVFNSRIKQIPDIVIANFLKYEEKDMFKADAQENRQVEILLKQ
ncbi:MAG: LemA family protein [Endomicrobium sp.]|jgi:LemA protein|nr:LemA family protein [Endomicrobium sp.]